MVLALVVIGAIALAWALGAMLLAGLRRISFQQALLLVPVVLAHRLGVRGGANLRGDPPTLYAILHQSRLDPALMLALLPEDTLHILDVASARSAWLEPWRAMARTIPFNPEHVFVSRRLVRHLKGNGRLAVYFPDGIEPDSKPYRLYRAVARIALRAEAKVVPVSVHGSRNTVFASSGGQRRGLFAKLGVVALEPFLIPELVARSGQEQTTATAALFNRVAEADAA
jgi:acyl-[acyl-carrier-protein]-phospholipid O-acyltransferase/long-chain-fatty-acid--[acyl-carrier-protein] ligase